VIKWYGCYGPNVLHVTQPTVAEHWRKQSLTPIFSPYAIVVLLRWQGQLGRWRCFFLTCHHGAGGEYGSMSRLGLLIGNRRMSRLQDCWVVLECANCWQHVTVEGALNEAVVMVSLNTVSGLSLLSQCLPLGKRMCGWGRAVTRRAFTYSRRDQMTQHLDDYRWSL